MKKERLDDKKSIWMTKKSIWMTKKSIWMTKKSIWMTKKSIWTVILKKNVRYIQFSNCIKCFLFLITTTLSANNGNVKL